MMLRIAICDDDVRIGGQIEGHLSRICGKLSVQFDSEVYFTGEELCKKLSLGECYDLIFLDIELITTTGIEVGTIIRDKINDELTQIVYISVIKDYALELFKIRPLDFLIKPISCDNIEKVINKFLKITGFWLDTFTYTRGHDTFKIKLKDIMYFESYGKKIVLHLKDKEEGFYGKLSDIYDSQLMKYDFLFINQSYIVNFDYVASFEYEQVILLNGIDLPISQPKRKAIRERQSQIVKRRL